MRMRKNIVLAAVLAAFGPHMIVDASGGGSDDRDMLHLVVTNNGDRKLSVTGTKDDGPVGGRQSAEVKLNDASEFAVSFDDSGDDTDDAQRSAEDRKAKIEIRNKSGHVLTLRADGANHSIAPGDALSLTVLDLDTVELINSSVAAESVGNQAGSPDTPGADELTNQDRAGPEGEASTDGEASEAHQDMQTT